MNATRLLRIVALAAFAAGCGAAARGSSSATDDAAASGDEAAGVLVTAGDIHGQRILRYRGGSDTSWWLRCDEKTTLRVPGAGPRTSRRQLIYRIDRRGVTPDGNLHYAIEMVEGTAWASPRSKPRTLPTLAGLEMTFAIGPSGDWKESRWELPPGTPQSALTTAESVQKVFYVAFPTIPLGPGAKWKTKFLGTTADLKTASNVRASHTLGHLDGDQALVEVDESITGPREVVETEDGPVTLDGAVTHVHSIYTVRFDHLISEGSRVVRAKFRLKGDADAGADAFGSVVIEETIATIPPPPPK